MGLKADDTLLRIALASVLSLVVLLFAGCDGVGEGTRGGDTGGTGTAGETTGTPADEETATGGVVLGQTCDNEELQLRIAYPDAWHTNTGDVAPACSYFHPSPFELPPDTEALDVAIRFDQEPVPFELIAEEAGGRAERLLSREDTEVAGREALVVESEATGEALLPEGVQSYMYYVRLDDERTLVAATNQGEGLDYARNKQILDAMTGRLEFLEASPSGQ